MKCVLLTLMFLFYAPSLFAQIWETILEHKNGNTIEIDINSIKKSDNLVYVWVKETHRNDSTIKEYIDSRLAYLHEYEYKSGIPSKILLQWTKYKYSLSYMTYDCLNDKYKTLSIIDYDSDGNVLYTIELDDIAEFSRVVPGSMAHGILSYIKEVNSSHATGTTPR